MNGSTAVTTSLITGSSNGIFANGSIGVTNFASITANTFDGINLGSGGSIANGSAADTKASIIGGAGTSGSGIFVGAGAATVTNFATISSGGDGHRFRQQRHRWKQRHGGKRQLCRDHCQDHRRQRHYWHRNFYQLRIAWCQQFWDGQRRQYRDQFRFERHGKGDRNGGEWQHRVTTSLITGSSNGIFASGSIGVTNFASIAASTFNGIFLGSGGSIVNGSAADTKASIIGAGTSGSGIFVSAGAATVTNLATISGGGSGIGFGNNGTVEARMVVNGSSAVTTAKIIGGSGTVGAGIFVSTGSVAVTNLATIAGAGDGINFGANGTSVATGRVVNGSTADTTAASLAISTAYSPVVPSQ